MSFALNGDGIVGIDLDDCRDLRSKNVAPWAQAIIARFNSYTELSPSGCGIRILVRGQLPPSGRKKGQIEVYDTNKFLTITGHKLTCYGAGDGIEDRSAELLAWHAEVFGTATDSKDPTGRKGSAGSGANGDGGLVINNPPVLDPDRLASLFKEKPKAEAVYQGEGDYGSQSEADLALANFAVSAGWDDQEVCDLLVSARLNMGEAIKPVGYFARTIDKARGHEGSGQGAAGSATAAPEARGHAEQGETVSATPVQPLVVSAGRVPVLPYPIEVFPQEIQDFAGAVAKALPCPLDFPGVLMLPVLGGCIGRKRRICIKGSWVEYPCIWAGVVARPSERKTPAFNEVLAPVRQRQKALLARYLREKEKYQALSAEGKKGQDKPRLRQVQTTDATIEGLRNALAGDRHGITYAADELSGWLLGHSQYKGGRGNDRQHYLSVWSGTQVVCNRAGMKEPIIINDPFVAITGGFQPATVGDLVADGHGDGMAARFLLAWPDLPNDDWTWDTCTAEAIKYNGICKSLWGLPDMRGPLAFMDEAREAWEAWARMHRKDKVPDVLAAVWGKAEGYCARLSLVLHMLRQVCNLTRDTGHIEAADLEGAIKLVAYFKSHARRVYSCASGSADKDRITSVLKWLRRRQDKGQAHIPIRDMHMAGVGGCKTSAEAEDLARYLEEQGYGTIGTGPRGGKVYTHNPGPL